MARGHMIGSRGWDADARVVQQRQTGEGGVCIETGDEEGGGEVGWGGGSHLLLRSWRVPNA